MVNFFNILNILYNMADRNFKICVGDKCINSKNIEKYDKLMYNNKCILDGVNLNIEDGQSVNDLDFNLCINDKCMDKQKVYEFEKMTRKYECIQNNNIESDSNLTLKVCSDGKCLKSDTVNKLVTKMYQYQDKIKQQKELIKSDFSKYDMKVPSVTPDVTMYGDLISKFTILDIELDELTNIEQENLINVIKNTFSNILEIYYDKIDVFLKKGSIKVEVVLNNVDENLVIPNNLRDILIRNIIKLNLKKINPYNISKVNTSNAVKKFDSSLFEQTPSPEINNVYGINNENPIFNNFNDIIPEIIDDIKNNSNNFLKKVIDKVNILKLSEKKKFIKILPSDIKIDDILHFLDYNECIINFKYKNAISNFKSRISDSIINESYLDMIKHVYKEETNLKPIEILFGTNFSEFESNKINDINSKATFLLLIVKFSNQQYLPKILALS